MLEEYQGGGRIKLCKNAKMLRLSSLPSSIACSAAASIAGKWHVGAKPPQRAWHRDSSHEAVQARHEASDDGRSLITCALIRPWPASATPHATPLLKNQAELGHQGAHDSVLATGCMHSAAFGLTPYCDTVWE